MKKWIKTLIIYQFFLILLIGFIVLGNKVIRLFFDVSHCECQVSDFVAHHAKKDLEKFLQLHKQDAPKQLITTLLTDFPIIQTVSSHYQPPNQLIVSLEAHKPLMCINDMVLLKTGALVDKSLFVDKAVCALPSLLFADTLIPETLCLAQPYVSVLEQLPSRLIEEYAFFFKSEHEILLQSKTQKAFIIVTDMETVLDYTLLGRCNDLKKELSVRGSFQNQSKHWVADIRFDRQIVLRADRGKDGKSFS